jgi:aminomethyltransferase
MHTSPLAEVHVERGARLTDFAGWSLPLRFGSELAEHRAVRERAGLFDLSHMAQIEVAGDGAPAALDFALAGRHSAMPVGRAAYSFLLEDDGGIMDDLIVYRLGETDFLVIANGANRETVADELSRRAEAFGASVVDRTFGRALLAVQGPRAAEILDSAGLGEVADSLRYYRVAPAAFGAVPVLVARTGYTGEDGFELIVRAGDGPGLWRALEDIGAPLGLTPAGLAARDTLRLEAGMPLYGHELTREVTPFDAGLGGFVDLAKHRFTGRAALLRAAETGPARRLLALVGEGRRAARAGSRVIVGGRDEGEVTSGALSPTLGAPIALASVRAAGAPEPGERVTVEVRGAAQPFTVIAPPIYRRPTK